MVWLSIPPSFAPSLEPSAAPSNTPFAAPSASLISTTSAGPLATISSVLWSGRRCCRYLLRAWSHLRHHPTRRLLCRQRLQTACRRLAHQLRLRFVLWSIPLMPPSGAPSAELSAAPSSTLFYCAVRLRIARSVSWPISLAFGSTMVCAVKAAVTEH